MVKQRFTSADVAAQVACLRTSCLGARCANVYDLNPRTYLFKLNRSGGDQSEGEGEGASKTLLLLESGARFHTTQFMRDKSDTPSNIALKLRMHLRTRRLVDVRQLGADRVVVFTFGSGEAAHHLVLELFSQGNIILCDATWTILTLLRSHRDDAADLQILPRGKYPLGAVRGFVRTPPAEVLTLLTTAPAEEQEPPPSGEPAAAAAAAVAESTGTSKRQARRKGGASATALSALAAALPYGPALAEHCLTSACVATDQPLPLPEGAASAVADAVRSLEDWFAATLSGGEGPAGGTPGTQLAPPKGYVRVKPGAGESSDVIEDFWPFQPHPLAGGSPAVGVKEYPTFDSAVDAAFSTAELGRSQQARGAAESAALSKLERMRLDQAQRAAALDAEARAEESRASLIEYNLAQVDAALGAVNEALAGGTEWSALERLIKDERKAGNPVAALIQSLDLAHGRVTLVLSNLLDCEEECEDEEAGEAARTRKASLVVLQLCLSAAANARELHAARKKHLLKAGKTLQAAAETLQAAERKAAAAVAAARAGAGAGGRGCVPLRRPCWFERYAWFLTSENALVLAGRDPVQTAALLRRHLAPGDAVVCADCAGAPLCIVKQPPVAAPPAAAADDGPPSAPPLPPPPPPIATMPPPMSLHQAGTWCVCRSSAWTSKFSTSAWCAPATAVVAAPQALPPDGTQNPAPAPAGATQLPGAPPGWMLARGARRELPPSQLVLSLGVLFRLDEQSAHAHAGERAVRSGEASAQAEAEAEPDEAEGEGEGEGEAEAEAEAEGESSSDSDHQGEPEAEPQPQPQPEGEPEGEPDAEEEEEEEEHSADEGQRQRDSRAASAAPARPSPRAGATAAASAFVAPLGCGGNSGGGVRGRSGKAKKVRDKYGDQDAEDRALALQALASAGQSRKALHAAAEAARKAAAAAEAARRQGARAASLAAPSPGGGGGGGGGGGRGGRGGGRGAGAAGTRAGAGGGGEAEVEEEGLTEGPAALALGLHSHLAQLTGCPRTGDGLLCAVPVCAPAAALAAYKFRVKLTPGTSKKGKVAKQVLDAFARTAAATPRERELLAACPEAEAVNALVGAVKLSLASLGKLGPPLKIAAKQQQAQRKTQRGEKK